MSQARPIRPHEVAKRKRSDFPEAVLEAFNQLIAQNYSGGYATVKQPEVVALMVEKGLKREDIFKHHWLDVEEVYRAAGWKVEYDKPAYCESYEAFFTFRK